MEDPKERNDEESDAEMNSSDGDFLEKQEEDLLPIRPTAEEYEERRIKKSF